VLSNDFGIGHIELKTININQHFPIRIPKNRHIISIPPIRGKELWFIETVELENWKKFIYSII